MCYLSCYKTFFSSAYHLNESWQQADSKLVRENEIKAINVSLDNDLNLTHLIRIRLNNIQYSIIVKPYRLSSMLCIRLFLLLQKPNHLENLLTVVRCLNFNSLCFQRDVFWTRTKVLPGIKQEF